MISIARYKRHDETHNLKTAWHIAVIRVSGSRQVKQTVLKRNTLPAIEGNARRLLHLILVTLTLLSGTPNKRKSCIHFFCVALFNL